MCGIAKALGRQWSGPAQDPPLDPLPLASQVSGALPLIG